MRALTVVPEEARSARVEEVAEPAPEDGAVLVESLAVGVCGTDLEIVEGRYGWAPPRRERLIIGHESLGRVVEAPTKQRVIYWRSDSRDCAPARPVPCSNCPIEEWDICRNGLYTERGIKQRDGYCSKWFRIEPEYAVKLSLALEDVGVPSNL